MHWTAFRPPVLRGLAWHLGQAKSGLYTGHPASTKPRDGRNTAFSSRAATAFFATSSGRAGHQRWRRDATRDITGPQVGTPGTTGAPRSEAGSSGGSILASLAPAGGGQYTFAQRGQTVQVATSHPPTGGCERESGADWRDRRAHSARAGLPEHEGHRHAGPRRVYRQHGDGQAGPSGGSCTFLLLLVVSG